MVSRRSWVRIPFRPELFFRLWFHNCLSCVHNCDHQLHLRIKGTLMVDIKEDWDTWKSNNSVSLSCRRSSAFWVWGVTPHYGLVYVTPVMEALQSSALTSLARPGKVFYIQVEIKGTNRCPEYPSSYEYYCPIRVQYEHFLALRKYSCLLRAILIFHVALYTLIKVAGYENFQRLLTVWAFYFI